MSSLYSVVVTTLLIAQVIGAGLIIAGSVSLIRGVRGSGQSERGVSALRASLISLLMPLSLGVIGLIGLFGLTLWERSPLTTLIQGIAPLSTLVWMIWSHYSARDVKSGEMFEALVPLIPRAEILPPELRELALQHRAGSEDESRSLAPRELVKTALQAVDDYREHNPEAPPLSLDELLTMSRDSLSDVRIAARDFPLGQMFTLADWLYEGERLTDLWRRGLKQIERGRALVNPLTIIDHKGFWGWSRANPATLFERELASWLHSGLYALITHRLCIIHSDASNTASHSTSQVVSQAAPERGTEPQNSAVPELWRVLSRKLSVPLWLYWGLGAIAVTQSHGVIGLALSITSGLLLGVSINYTVSIARWRAAFCELGKLRRPSRAQEESLNASVSALKADLLARLDERLEREPLSAMLEFTREMSVGIAVTYRRAEHPQMPLSLLNATVIDALQTAESICDDVLTWRKSGGVLPILIGVLSRFGVGAERVESLIIDSARDWAFEGSPSEPEAASLTERAANADQWLSDQLSGLNFILRTPAELALSQLYKQLRELITEELDSRALPLYQGVIGDPPQ